MHAQNRKVAETSKLQAYTEAIQRLEKGLEVRGMAAL
jgi:hypothetical protein